MCAADGTRRRNSLNRISPSWSHQRIRIFHRPAITLRVSSMGQRPSMQTSKRGHAWSDDPPGVVSWGTAGRSAAGCGGIGGFWRRRRRGMDVPCVVSLRLVQHFEVPSCGNIPWVVACVHDHENRRSQHGHAYEQRTERLLVAYAAYNRQDSEALLALVREDVDIQNVEASPR